MGVEVDHRSITQRPIEPHADWPVKVLAGPPREFVTLVIKTDEHSHLDLLVSLVDHDPTDSPIRAAKVDSKLKFADIALPKPKRMTQPLRFAVRTGRPHLATLAALARAPSIHPPAALPDHELVSSLRDFRVNAEQQI